MLHLIFQSPIEDSVLQRIDSGDDVVFYENSIFQINKEGMLNTEIQQLLKRNVAIHVLREELETRGICVDELVTGIEVIDYPGLVHLTQKNKLVRTWN